MLIPVGAELTFIDDPSIKVKVLDDSHILYNNETTLISALAKRGKNSYPGQGTLWFKYNGEVLNDFRKNWENRKIVWIIYLCSPSEWVVYF